MNNPNPAVEAYIAKAAPFAQPILQHLRQLVHRVCPEVEEKIKWSFPFFDYQGPLCHVAAFKQHCAFGFWKAAIMKDAALLTGTESHTAMGNLGKITSLNDLPSDKKITAWIKEAMQLNEQHLKVPKNTAPKYPKKEAVAPPYLLAALKKNKAALKTFEAFPPSHKREYIEWITEAKREETRARRLEQAVAQMAEGKGRNWRYEKNK